VRWARIRQSRCGRTDDQRLHRIAASKTLTHKSSDVAAD
jgi:hypothetical protein